MYVVILFYLVSVLSCFLLFLYGLIFPCFCIIVLMSWVSLLLSWFPVIFLLSCFRVFLNCCLELPCFCIFVLHSVTSPSQFCFAMFLCCCVFCRVSALFNFLAFLYCCPALPCFLSILIRAVQDRCSSRTWHPNEPLQTMLVTCQLIRRACVPSVPPSVPSSSSFSLRRFPIFLL